MNLKEAIEKAREKKRKFTQTIELVINFQNIDFNKPENKLNLEIALPKGCGKPKKICLICGDELAKTKETDKIILDKEMESLGKDKKKVKKLASEFDFFLAQTNLMALVGKHLGQVLGPRGKMPKPIPPNIDIKPLVGRLRNTVIVRTKGKNLPVVHVPIGMESMPVDDLVENAKTVLSTIETKLPQKQANIKCVYVKTSMGGPIKFDMGD